MSDDSQQSQYPAQSARDLLAWMRHSIKQDTAKIDAAAQALLAALHEVAGQAGPISVGPVQDPKPEAPAVLMTTPTSWARLSYDPTNQRFRVLGKYGGSTLVPITYDPARDAFIPFNTSFGLPTYQALPEPSTETTLEVVVRELYGASLK